MRVAISWNGTMALLEDSGQRKVYAPYETAKIISACYSFVQKKRKGQNIGVLI